MKNIVVSIYLIIFTATNLQAIQLQTAGSNPTQVAAPDFSAGHGFYENSFNLIINPPVANATIKYTLDGSDPRTSPTALVQNSPTGVLIDPESTAGNRGKTPGVTLRACTVAPDNSVSEVVTNTYLFINKVGVLSPDRTRPGAAWPNPTTSGQSIDYGMDPDVLNDPRYKNLLDDALLAIPSVSIVTDLKNLFNASTGIYVNASQDGINWERPASIELLNPDGSEGFQINAGIRIRGGASRSGSNPKHAFRFFFRSEYGKGKLKYPLFENEGVDEFDKVDLRTSQNYSWSFPNHQGEYNVMNRDVFSRDLAREMGQPYTRSRYYHLYINGYYWGLFQTQERSEARYAASYFGGSVEDYDVIKTDDNWPPHIEVTDGNQNAYREVWNLCVAGFQNNSNYFKLQGLNEDGTSNPDYKNLVDIDNLIDFMLIVFYAGNFDCPITIWSNNKNPRNFYCIYNRNRDDGFKFFVHDAEHTLRTTPGEHWETVGVNENRVNLGNLPANNPYRMMVNSFSDFHPQWLHFKLSENAEYRIRFADHVYRHFFNEGCLTPAKTTQLFLKRANEIEMAIIAESARWGDTYSNPPRTKDDDWQPAIDDIVNNYFPKRTGIVLNQLKGVGLYPGINPPVFTNNNVEISAKTLQVEPAYLLKIRKPGNVNGTIRYTIDGHDPRMIGGSAAGSAIDGGDEVEVTISTTTVIKTRIQNGNTWSALHEIVLFVDDNAGNLKITEIQYHPLDGEGVSDNEFEFLELKNTGATPINLTQTFFENGIGYTFPSGAIIDPDGFIVLGSDREQFNNRYGFYPSGEYSGQLNNNGESIILRHATGDTILSVSYSDQAPWPESADGGGLSLVTKETNPGGDLSEALNWRTSYQVHGSPGQDDMASTSVEAPTELPSAFALYQNYPNPFNPGTMIQYNLKHSSKVRLAVYDLIGREVALLVEEVQNAGSHTIMFSGAGLASGIYFYRLQTPDAIITKKMALVK